MQRTGLHKQLHCNHLECQRQRQRQCQWQRLCQSLRLLHYQQQPMRRRCCKEYVQLQLLPKQPMGWSQCQCQRQSSHPNQLQR